MFVSTKAGVSNYSSGHFMAENKICLFNKTPGSLIAIFVGTKHLSWATTLVSQNLDFKLPLSLQKSSTQQSNFHIILNLTAMKGCKTSGLHQCISTAAVCVHNKSDCTTSFNSALCWEAGPYQHKVSWLQ